MLYRAASVMHRDTTVNRGWAPGAVAPLSLEGVPEEAQIPLFLTTGFGHLLYMLRNSKFEYHDVERSFRGWDRTGLQPLQPVACYNRSPLEAYVSPVISTLTCTHA
jgi:hypothetical protein